MVDITRAEGLVGQALAVSPRSALTHFAKGHLLRAHNRYDEAASEYETVLLFNRNWMAAISDLGLCKFYIGSWSCQNMRRERRIRGYVGSPSIPGRCDQATVSLLQPMLPLLRSDGPVQ